MTLTDMLFFFSFLIENLFFQDSNLEPHRSPPNPPCYISSFKNQTMLYYITLHALLHNATCFFSHNYNWIIPQKKKIVNPKNQLKTQYTVSQPFQVWKKIPGKYMLVVDLYISVNFISNVQAKRFHLLVGNGNCKCIKYTAFTIVGNKLVSLSQVPSWSFLCSSLVR